MLYNKSTDGSILVDDFFSVIPTSTLFPFTSVWYAFPPISLLMRAEICAVLCKVSLIFSCALGSVTVDSMVRAILSTRSVVCFKLVKIARISLPALPSALNCCAA